jgi:putative nucleotidyltransferase with HDIG domain
MERRLGRAEEKVQILEKMMEDRTRDLYIANEQAVKQNNFISNVIESFTYPFYVVDADDYTIKVTNSASKIGVIPGSMTFYEHFYKWRTPCNDAAPPHPLEKVVSSKKAVMVVYPHYDANNSHRTIEICCYPIMDGNGLVRYISVYTFDVSHTKVVSVVEAGEELKQLAALRSIDKAIIGSMDINVTLDIIINEVRSTLMVDAANILLLNPHLDVLEYASGAGFKTQALRHTRLRVGDSYAGRVALERKAVHISNIMEAGEGFKQSKHLVEEGFVAYYGIPLIAKGEVKGVLEVFHRSALQNDPGWVEFLEALAGQAAIAIDGASMFENLQRANINLTLAYDETIEGWSRAMDLRDKETEGHSQRVTELTLHVAREMNLRGAELAHMRRGALLHDIGKMGIPDNILLKPGPLNEDEWVIMREHPVLARELLFPIRHLRPSLDIPYCHHEKWDGTGYPQGLIGEQIPLSARIFAVVDIFDAMTSDRPYRSAMSKEEVLEHIRSLSGSHLDPKIVDVMLKVSQEIHAA